MKDTILHLLNNSVLPSTEPDKKAFSFDIIPASLVDNITIYKSPTPDLPGDFAGGAVKVTTKDYPTKALSELNTYHWLQFPDNIQTIL